SFDSYRSSNSADRDRLNPKLGISWNLAPGSVLRAGYFETLKRTTVGGQTIEPTQIAGFNQLFDDLNATRSKRWGIGLDQKISEQLVAGAEWSRRELGVPALAGSPPVPIELSWKEDVAHGYLSWIATERFSLNLGPEWERFVRNVGTNDQNFLDRNLLRVPL